MVTRTFPSTVVLSPFNSFLLPKPRDKPNNLGKVPCKWRDTKGNHTHLALEVETYGGLDEPPLHARCSRLSSGNSTIILLSCKQDARMSSEARLPSYKKTPATHILSSGGLVALLPSHDHHAHGLE